MSRGGASFAPKDLPDFTNGGASFLFVDNDLQTSCTYDGGAEAEDLVWTLSRSLDGGEPTDVLTQTQAPDHSPVVLTWVDMGRDTSYDFALRVMTTTGELLYQSAIVHPSS